VTWTTDDIPDLTGKRAVITGVTGFGLGHHTALELARKGAELVVTARNAEKVKATVADIEAQVPGAVVDVVDLDLSDLARVVAAADEVRDRYDRVDILVNNAGIMATPKATMADGFELQVGTNHLGHFAWTATLWPLLASSSARVVTISSLAHTWARGIDLDAFTPEGSSRRYGKWRVYGESKLMNLLFAKELDRRVKAAGLDVVSVAAHPGYSATNLQKTGLAMGNKLFASGVFQVSKIIGQPPAAGAWPALRAATEPGLEGGEYFGPNGPGGYRGRPKHAGMTRFARDPDLAAQLWSASESATGITFPL
jgi:NAD(P)-dependent dehydrogenase (short-subunit alcohol dehydrogenase family)